MSGVRKNNAAQINGGRRRVNRPAKSFFHQAWNPSAMVQMCVRENDRVDLLGRNRRISPVALAPLFRPLKKTAVHENLEAALAGWISGVDQMLRSGNGSRRAQKLDVGQAFPPDSNNSS